MIINPQNLKFARQIPSSLGWGWGRRQKGEERRGRGGEQRREGGGGDREKENMNKS